MTREQYRAINSGLCRVDRPITAYTTQVSNARLRGIGWNLTFGEWWAIWTDSGHWDKRGRGHGRYVMSRHGDIGPYAVGNVAIKLANENTSEAIRRTRALGKFSACLKEVSPEVLELIELRKSAVIGPHKIETLAGYPKGAWENIRRGKRVTPERYETFRNGFLGRLNYGSAPTKRKAA